MESRRLKQLPKYPLLHCQVVEEKGFGVVARSKVLEMELTCIQR
jgi:hypothetical protein